MFRKGTRIFSTATILQLVVAALHTMGLFNVPQDERGLDLLRSMRNYKIELGLGMEPSVFDIQMSLGLTMTIFLVCFAALNTIVVLRLRTTAIVRAITLVNAICMWALTGLYFYYKIPPPMISFATLSVLFSIALLRRPELDSS